MLKELTVKLTPTQIIMITEWNRGLGDYITYDPYGWARGIIADGPWDRLKIIERYHWVDLGLQIKASFDELEKKKPPRIPKEA